MHKSARINLQLSDSLIKEINLYSKRTGVAKSKLINDWVRNTNPDLKYPTHQQKNFYNFNLTDQNQQHLDAICTKYKLSKSEALRLIIKDKFEEQMLDRILIDLEKYDLRDYFQFMVDSINKSLGLHGTLFAVIKNNRIYARAFRYRYQWDIGAIRRIMGGPIENIGLPIQSNTQNLVVNSVQLQKPLTSTHFYDFARGILSETLSSFAASLVGIKSGLSFPLIYKGRVLGVLFLMKNYPSDFEQEIVKLNDYPDILATQIVQICTEIERMKH